MIAKLANMECELYKSNEQYPSLESRDGGTADPDPCLGSICIFLQNKKQKSKEEQP